ncbi:MAG: hypothetical protein C4311_12105 [Chloroflexota bacterium]
MRVAVIGAGYVGLVTGVGLATVGHDVTCVEINASRVAAINAGRSPLHEPGLAERLQATLAAGRFRAASVLPPAVRDAQVILICVGTPSAPTGAIDLQAVQGAARQIGQALRQVQSYRVVAVKSTVVPGTTEGVIGPTVWAAAGQGVENIGLAMNPEFLREGDAVADFLAPDRIVVGAIDARSAEVMRELYAPFNAPLFITNPRTAEMIKYTSNALLATLISFSNQIAAICEATPDVDVQTVMDAVHMDRRLTPVMGGRPVQPGILAYLRAGAGFGGSCLPKDVKALRAYARAVHAPTELLDAVLAINDQRPRHLVKLAENALGSLAGRTVAVLGLTFKPGSDDLRDSPALRVVELLQEAGAHVRGYDPMITPDGAAQHSLHMSANGNGIEICTSARQALTNADAALITTGWRDFASLDWSEMASVMRMPIVVDGRRILDGAHGLDGVTLLKIGYKAI